MKFHKSLITPAFSLVFLFLFFCAINQISFAFNQLIALSRNVALLQLLFCIIYFINFEILYFYI